MNDRYSGDAVARAVDYIEAHLCERIRAGEVAAAAHFSVRQLYREFYSATGYSIMGYARKRRAHMALAMIKASDLPLAEIALSCGYSSQQALCSHIKDETGMTPTEYASSERHFIFPRYSGARDMRIEVSTLRVPACLRLEFTDTRLVGIEARSVRRALDLLPGFSGRIFGHNGRQSPGGFTYNVLIERESCNLPNVPAAEILPSSGRLFAQTTVTFDDKKIEAAWGALSADWLSGSAYRRDGDDYLEEYFMRDKRIDRLRLMLPVVRREYMEQAAIRLVPGMRFLTASARGPEAERQASRLIVSYITSIDPHFLIQSSRFLVEWDEDRCTCGIEAGKSLQGNPRMGVHEMQIEEGYYALLDCGYYADYLPACGALARWMAELGVGIRENKPFAIYTKSMNEATMRVYCKV